MMVLRTDVISKLHQGMSFTAERHPTFVRPFLDQRCPGLFLSNPSEHPLRAHHLPFPPPHLLTRHLTRHCQRFERALTPMMVVLPSQQHQP